MMWSWWSVPLHIGRQAFFVKSFLLIASNSRNSEAAFWYIFEYGVGQILKMLGYALYTTDGIFHAYNSIIHLFLVWYIWYFMFIEHKLYFYEFLVSLNFDLWQINSCRKIHRSYLLLIIAFLVHISIIFVLVALELPVRSQILLLKTFAHESIDKTIIKFSKSSLDSTSDQ